jgi:hypothetical protein
MKIRPEQLNNLLPVQGVTTGAPGGQTKATGAFEDILAEEQLRVSVENSGSAIAPPPPGTGRTDIIGNMLLGVEEETPVSADEAVLDEAFGQVSGTLDLLDKYSASLGSADSLREAYSLLNDIDGKVADIEQDAARLRTQNPVLDSLLDELKTIALTEKIKFNRGDYLPE